MATFSPDVLKKIIKEIDGLLKEIDTCQEEWTAAWKKLKDGVEACNDACDDTVDKLTLLLKKLPNGPYDAIRQGAEDTRTLLNQQRGVFARDANLDEIVVSRKLTDALADLERIKKVIGMERFIPSGLWSSIDKFNEKVKTVEGLQKSLSRRKTGDELRKDVVAKLKELVTVTQTFRAD